MIQHEAILVLCTAPSADVAADLGKRLVEAKLAACVNLIPGVRSFFFWDGAVQDESEVQLFIKSRKPLLPALEALIAEHHPYEVPEILAIDIADGSRAYLEWLVAGTMA